MNHRNKKIHMDSAKPGMVIAKDILSDSGIVLVPKNARLNQKYITKLNFYQVKYIEIQEKISDKEFISNPSSVKNNSKHNTISVTKTAAFKEFEASHNNQKENLKYQLLDISEGKKIDMSELFSLSSSLMKNLGDKTNLFTFLSGLQEFDDYTYSHSVNVSLVSYTLGQWLGFTEEDLVNIAVAGILHDIGKSQIDINLLNKPGKLTHAEYEEIKKHTVYGFRIVEKQKIPYNIKMAVLMHHEKIDGSGYPMQATDTQINDFAKIVAIADIYDAMTANRPYRDKFCPFDVIRHMHRTYLGKLDTKYLMTFLEKIAYCYLDSWVRLSSGEEGKIKFINKMDPSSPIIQIDNVLVDLSKENSLHIEDLL